MCIICTHYDDGLLSGNEALANIMEMAEIVGEDHAQDVMGYIINREMDDIMMEFDIKIDNLWPTLSS